jgi:hypothetical protein
VRAPGERISPCAVADHPALYLHCPPDPVLWGTDDPLAQLGYCIYAASRHANSAQDNRGRDP